MKSSVSLDGILSFIHSLSLGASNKRWLGGRLLEEARNEQAGMADRTDKMLEKHFGVWKDEREAEEIAEDLRAHRNSFKQPLERMGLSW